MIKLKVGKPPEMYKVVCIFWRKNDIIYLLVLLFIIVSKYLK